MNWIAFTFGDSANWSSAAKRLQGELEETSIFEKVYCFDEDSLVDSEQVLTPHKKFIANNSRGFGYWIWKPMLFAALVRKYPDKGLVYFDAGCELNWNCISKRRFTRYLSKAKKHGILVFQMKHLENRWSKGDLINHFLPSQFEYPSGQVSASVIFRTPSDKDEIFVNWAKFASYKNYSFLDDSISKFPNHSSFQENRHDQSILSMLLKQQNVRLFRDESHNPRFLPRVATPIWAIRNNSELKILPEYIKRSEYSWFGL